MSSFYQIAITKSGKIYKIKMYLAMFACSIATLKKLSRYHSKAINSQRTFIFN